MIKGSFRVLTVFLILVGMVLFHATFINIAPASEQRFIQERSQREKQWANRIAPYVALETVDGKPFRLEEVIGKKTIVLNFFATWCGPCREEIPTLLRFQKKYKKEWLLLLFINVKEDPETVKAFVQREHISVPVLLDKDGKVAKRYQVKGIPTTVVINVLGKIQLYKVGAIFNAEAILHEPCRISFFIAKKGKKISPDRYLQQVKRKEERETLSPEKVEIAKHIRCPSCDKNAWECNDRFGKEVIHQLANMDIQGKNTEEILRELFLYD